MDIIILISKTSDGQRDYVQITTLDQTSLNIVLVADTINVQDKRDEQHQCEHRAGRRSRRAS